MIIIINHNLINTEYYLQTQKGKKQIFKVKDLISELVLVDDLAFKNKKSWLYLNNWNTE